MKIIVKRDKSSENSRYIVFSDTGDELYKIVGKHAHSSHRLYIMRKEERVAKIRDAQLPLLRACYVSGEDCSFHLTIATPKDKMAVTYHGVPLHIRGDVLNKSYDILDIDNTVISCVCRRFSTCYDALEINISDNKYEIHSIATAVCLDSICTIDAMVLQAT